MKEKINNKLFKAGTIIPGMLLTFKYEAKTPNLPYWDINPLSLIIGTYRDGFLGLNFHYLPLSIRKEFMKIIKKTDEDALKQINTKSIKISIIRFLHLNKKLILSYSKLKTKRYRIGLAIIKRYLYSQLRSNIYVVKYEYWDDFLLLNGKFVSDKPISVIYKETMRKIYGR